MSYGEFRAQVWQWMDGDRHDGKIDKFFYYGLLSLIVINFIAIFLESIPEIKAHKPYHDLLNKVELYSLYIFAIEYLVRLWAAPKRRKFFISPMGLVDLCALAPLFLPFFGIDMRKINWLRAIRVMRMVKLIRFIPGIDLIMDVLTLRKKELMATLGLLCMLLLCGSTMMYYIEGKVQPDKFGSVPLSMWWGVVTMTTTGYGDAFPITAVGKIVGGLYSIMSIFMFALPTAIIGSGFLEEINKRIKK